MGPMSCLSSTLSGKLTAKQLKVCKLAGKGYSNQQIAQLLGNTPQSIKNYLRDIYDILGFSNKLELALFMVKELTLAELENTEIMPRAYLKKGRKKKTHTLSYCGY